MSKNFDTEKIIARYKESPISIKQIASEFNLCSVTISRILKRANIPLWTRQDLNLGNLQVNYFEEIDTEVKAYLLGLFAADGCVYTKNGSKLFSIQLKEEDSYMIEYIKNELKAPRKIVYDKRDKSSSISIINDVFVCHLMKYGVLEGKSDRFFPNISEQLIPHYIRGLFDGDGSIIIRKAHSYGTSMRCCVVLLAHLKLINHIQNYLENRLNLSHLNLCSDGGDAYSIRYNSRKDFLAVTEFMYSDAHLFLKRKFQKYEQALLYLS